MKRLISLITILALLVISVPACAGDYSTYAYPFIGRWQPSETPALIDDYGFQDIQNLRRDGKRLKGVSGHSKINSSKIDTSYYFPRNGYHFKKDRPSETHVIVQAGTNAGSCSTKVYQNTTAIPDTGNFSATVLHTDDSSAGVGRMATWPQGDLAYCNGAESLVWGGDEHKLTSFFTCSDADNADPMDYTAELQSSRQDAGHYAILGSRGEDSYTVLLLHCEGADASTTFTDSSDSGHTVTANGDAQIDTDQQKFGLASGLFDNTGDDLSIPDSADWYMATGDFTIDGWIRQDARDTGLMDCVFSQYVDASNFVRLTITDGGGSDDEIDFVIVDGGKTDGALNYAVDLSIDTWHHIAVVRSSNDFYLFLNGTVVDSTTDSDDWPDLAGSVYIGSLDGSNNYFDGWIDEWRVSKGIARWTSNFTPPTSPYSGDPQEYALLGFTRPIQGFKAYIKTGNQETATLTVNESTGSAWSALTVTDNTASGGVSMYQTGTVTFDSTVDTCKPREIQGEYLFWYQIYLPAGGCEIYQITVDSPIQNVVDIWDAVPIGPIQFIVNDGTVFEDYTLEVNASSSSVEYDTAPYAAELDDLANDEYIYIAFPCRVAGINFNLSATNDNAATVTVYYHNGTAWTSVGDVVDGTDVGGDSLNQSGFISWNPPAKGEEFPLNMFGLNKNWKTPEEFPDIVSPIGGIIGIIGDVVTEGLGEFTKPIIEAKPGYYYKIMWSAALDSSVLVDTVTGIKAYEADSIGGYKFPSVYQGRAFLCNETDGEKNSCIYSAFNEPDVWNGSDAGSIRFGGDTELTASTSLYNLFYGNSGFEQKIFTKANETYRLIGESPDTWQIDTVSPVIGCPAPLTMAVCDNAEIEADVFRQVAIWQSTDGVVMYDGSKIQSISEDIKCYWDPNDSRCIPDDRIDDSYGWWDSTLGRYKLLISSGSGQSTHNVELEYYPKCNPVTGHCGEWTKIYRENASGANPIQCGFQVTDTSGNVYNYGISNDGYMYRLEYGNTWDSVENIDEMVWTKDLLYDPNAPLFKHTVVEAFRLMFEDKTTTPDPDIAITHYCNGTATTDNVNNQEVPDGIDMDDGPFVTIDCVLGPCLFHSFKLQAAENDVADGMGLNGLGLRVYSSETLME